MCVLGERGVLVVKCIQSDGGTHSYIIYMRTWYISQFDIYAKIIRYKSFGAGTKYGICMMQVFQARSVLQDCGEPWMNLMNLLRSYLDPAASISILCIMYASAAYILREKVYIFGFKARRNILFCE